MMLLWQDWWGVQYFKKHVCCLHVDIMAVSLCLQCNDTFCQDCSNYHRNLPATRHHCVENLATLTVEALAASHHSSCVTHPDKSADVFCSAHHIPICHSCAFLDHRECKDLTDLKAKTDEVQGQLTQFLTMLTDTELSLKHTACKLDQLVMQIDRNTQIEIHTLEEAFSHLQKLVEVSRRRLLEVVQNVNMQTKTRVNVVKENLIKHQKRALSHRFLVQRMQKIASDFKLFDMISNLKKFIDNLNLVACIPSELESALCTKLAVDPEMLNFLEQSLNHLRMVPVSKDTKEKSPEVELDETMAQIITANSGKELMLMTKSTFTEIESKMASTVISAESTADSPKRKKRSGRRNAKAKPLKKCEISEPLEKNEIPKLLVEHEISDPLQKCETSELLGNCETSKPLEECDKREPLEKCDKSELLEKCYKSELLEKCDKSEPLEVIATTVKSSENTNSRNKKYIYNEGQWSPVNPERKRQYDRDFLIMLRGNPQSCIWPAYLEKVPELDLNKIIAVGRGAVQHKTLLNLSVHLHKAENPYKPRILLHTADKDQTLYRQFRAILNKLTRMKFSTLVQKALMLEIYTEERMQGITHLLYEKALSEPTFSVAYANMCKSMIALSKVYSSSNPGELIQFRTVLLKKCQQEFENDKTAELDLAQREQAIECAPEEKKEELKKALAEASSKVRQRSLRNIRFIGELFKVKMLTENLVHDCVFKLLKNQDGESIECLCQLLTTIGRELETPKTKIRMDQYFQAINKMKEDMQSPTRISLMIQDLIDLRRNCWVPRRQNNNLTTDLVQEASQEYAKRGQLTHGGDHGRKVKIEQKEGWNTTSSVKAMWTPIDASKMKLSRVFFMPCIQTQDEVMHGAPELTEPNLDEANIQLGPSTVSQKFSHWGFGNQDSGSHLQNKTQPLTSRLNLLKYLGNDGRLPMGQIPARSNWRDHKAADFGRVTSVNQGPQESDHNKLVDIDKSLQPTGNGSSNPSSRNASRDNSRNRERPETIRRAGGPDILKMSSDQIDTKIKAIVEEYLHVLYVKVSHSIVGEYLYVLGVKVNQGYCGRTFSHISHEGNYV